MNHRLIEEASKGLFYVRATVSLLRKTKLYRDGPALLSPSLLRDVIRHGVGVPTIHSLHAHLHPNRLALVDERQRLTYSQVNSRINRLANGLRDEFGTGKHALMICLENRVEYMIAWMAAFRLGWPVVHASDSSTGEELRFLVDNSGAEIIIGSKKSALTICKALEDGDHSVSLVLWTGDASRMIEDGLDFDDFVALQSDQYPTRKAGSQSSENVVYTSGTTGRPKGTVRDFERVSTFETLEIFDRIPLGECERHLIVARLYHSAGQAFSILIGALGGTVYLHAKFDPEQVLKTIHNERITSMFFVPTMMRRLLNQPDELFYRYPPEDFRFFISGAAPFPQELREKAITRFGANAVHDFYGASELGWVTLIGGYEMLQRPGSVGMPLRSQHVRVITRDGELAAANEVGLIQVSNDQMMVGYLNNQSATDEITSDGWMTVEDTGYLDDGGYLYVTGRERDMVISGGVNIYPAEIEEILLRHPDIDEVAVIGIPDPDWGERLIGIVVPTGAPIDGDKISEWAKNHLTNFKVPRQWHSIEEMPRNDVGKILKRTLREQFGASK